MMLLLFYIFIYDNIINIIFIFIHFSILLSIVIHLSLLFLLHPFYHLSNSPNMWHHFQSILHIHLSCHPYKILCIFYHPTTIYNKIFYSKYSFSVHFSILIFSLIVSPIKVFHFSFSVNLIICKLSFINGTVFPYILSMPFFLIIHKSSKKFRSIWENLLSLPIFLIILPLSIGSDTICAIKCS